MVQLEWGRAHAEGAKGAVFNFECWILNDECRSEVEGGGGVEMFNFECWILDGGAGGGGGGRDVECWILND